MILAFILIRNNPEDVGLKAYEDISKKSSESGDDEALSVQYDYTLKEAFKSKMFPGFVLFIVMICTVVQGVLIQVPSYLNASGFDTTKIGLIVASYAFVASFGKIIIGWTYDKVGVFKGNFVFFSLMIASFFALIASQAVPQAVYLYVICAGLGLGLTPVAVPLLVSILFGTKHYSTLYPVFMIMMSFGAIVGGILAGLIIDSMGYVVFLQFAVVGILIAFTSIQATMKVAEKAHRVQAEKLAG